MKEPLILSIDQGTSNTKALLIGADGRIHARASAAMTSVYPHPGWAEQSAVVLWESVREVIATIVNEAKGANIAGIAIANQRESLVVWDATTGAPIAPCILWQCRRSAAVCEGLTAAGHGALVEGRTGLAINPLFPASKLGWVMQNVPAASDLARQGNLRAGTVDTWLLWNLTGGTKFATDHSNASRTQLFNTDTLEWDAELCALFGVPSTIFASVQTSDSLFGSTAEGATALGKGVPILAMMGDSHAALYGHGIRTPGLVKATYGTGSSLMALTPGRIASKHGLSGTIAWSTKTGVAYAIEGNITVSAQAAKFVSTLLGLSSVEALSALAQTVESSDGVTFVPALAGLGAPHWNDHAKGIIGGLTHASTPAHVARAAFEAIALQIRDVFVAMEADVGMRLNSLRADGGASSNSFLMQLQAELLGCDVVRTNVAEVGAIGVAAMAFPALGLDVGGLTSEDGTERFSPQIPEASRIEVINTWRRAVATAIVVEGTGSSLR